MKRLNRFGAFKKNVGSKKAHTFFRILLWCEFGVSYRVSGGFLGLTVKKKKASFVYNAIRLAIFCIRRLKHWVGVGEALPPPPTHHTPPTSCSRFVCTGLDRHICQSAWFRSKLPNCVNKSRIVLPNCQTASTNFQFYWRFWYFSHFIKLKK